MAWFSIARFLSVTSFLFATQSIARTKTLFSSPAGLILCLSALFCADAVARTIDVSDAIALQNALKTAQAGDEIVLQPGFYEGERTSSGQGNSHFFSDKSGTANAPIILRSYSKADQQAIQGSKVEERYALYITGDHWVIRDLIVHTAQKGIVLDNANYNVLDNIWVHTIGEEAVHFRDSSAYNLLQNCLITNTGQAGRPGYGEGVYIGSDNRLLANDLSSHNIVGGCQIGPGVSGEPFDVKENTTGTVIENNLLLGDAIAGVDFHFADSFIDIKGDEVIVRNNHMDYQGNDAVTHGVHALKNKTHVNSYYINNTVTISPSTPFIKIGEGTAHVAGTTLVNGGNRLVNTYSAGEWDSQIPNNIPPVGTYMGYSTTDNGSASSASSVPSSEPASSSSSTTSSSESSAASESSSSSASSINNDACLTYTLGARVELDLNAHTCITLETGSLAGKSVQVWDSDANDSCNFRGTLSDGTNTESINSNYQRFSDVFTGGQLTFADASCPYLKIRIR